MKPKNLLAIALGVLISTQTVFATTYKIAKSKAEPFNIPSAEKHQQTINRLSKNATISHYLSRGASGERVADGEFVVEIESKVIDGYAGWFDENVVIPSTLAGVNIERIGEGAFNLHYNLKKCNITRRIKGYRKQSF